MNIRHPRVLIIDDDPEICDLLRSILSREGFPVCTAADGPTALKLIGSSHFDLLVTDIRLPPPMDGIEVVRQARVQAPHLKSLFISGGEGVPVGDPRHNDFVSKPFDGRKIVGCVWELFSRRLPAPKSW